MDKDKLKHLAMMTHVVALEGMTTAHILAELERQGAGVVLVSPEENNAQPSPEDIVDSFVEKIKLRPPPIDIIKLNPVLVDPPKNFINGKKLPRKGKRKK